MENISVENTIPVKSVSLFPSEKKKKNLESAC